MWLVAFGGNKREEFTPADAVFTSGVPFCGIRACGLGVDSRRSSQGRVSVCLCGKRGKAVEKTSSPPVWSRAGRAWLFPAFPRPLPPRAGSDGSSAATGPSLTPSLTLCLAPSGTAAPTVAPWRGSPPAFPLAEGQIRFIHTSLRSKSKSNSESTESFVHLV